MCWATRSSDIARPSSRTKSNQGQKLTFEVPQADQPKAPLSKKRSSEEGGGGEGGGAFSEAAPPSGGKLQVRIVLRGGAWLVGRPPRH